MKRLLLISLLLLVISLAYCWDINRQSQFPTNFYALDRVGTTLWAAGYVGGFAKSTDNGQTWNFLPNPAYDAVNQVYKDINDIDFYDAQHGVMVSADGLVGITADGGTNWTTPAITQTLFGTDDVNGCFYMPDGRIWVVGWSGKILFSSDYGVNWAAQTSGTTDQIYAVSMNDSGVGFCALNNGTPDQAKVLTTTNFGANWTISNLTITANPHIYKVRQYGSTVVLAGSSGYVGVSADNGTNWTHQNAAGGASTNMQDIILTGNNGFAVGWNGVLLKTTTAWSTFETVTNDFGLYFEGINQLTNGNLLAVGWNGAIATSVNSGVNWTDNVVDALDLFSGKAVDENNWYLAGDKGYLLKTTNAGQSFSRLHIPGNFDAYYACYFKNAQEGWVTGKTLGKIFHTVNGGSTWDTFTVTGVASTKLYTEFCFVSDLIGYAIGVPTKSAKTTDGGLTWTTLADGGLTTSNNLNCAFFKSETVGFAGAASGTLFVTLDGCATWSPLVIGTTSAAIRDVWFKDDLHGVLVNSLGEIFYTINGGLTATDWMAGTESCLDDMNGVWCDANGTFWAAGYSSDNTSTNVGNAWSVIKSTNNGQTWTQETFPALTFNSTRFMGITGATGKLIAYGKNNLLISAANGGVEPPVGATNLFFSEYLEGTSNNKAIEIFNGTGQAVNLSGYSVNLAPNGTPWGATPLLLTGTLANNDVYVIANAGANATILAQSDVTSTVTYYNGNDALGLFQGTTLIDAIGIAGVDPGATVGWPVAGVANALAEHTLIRKPTVISPTTDWALSAGTNADDSQWLVNPQNYTTDLGVHTFTPNTGPSAATPAFNPPGGVYTSPINVAITSTTPDAVIYYTTDGTAPTTSSAIYSTPIPVLAAMTIKAMATAAAMANSYIASASYVFPVVAANLAALRAMPADNTTLYYVSGEVVLTFKQTYRSQKWLQDSTGGIMTDDLANVLSTAFVVGDGITGLTGKLYEYGGMLEFIPTSNVAAPSSTGNVIVPQVITLNDLTTNFESYESEVVKIMNCSFTTPTGNFANGIVYPISDASGTFSFRTSFYDVSYIGDSVPTIPVHVIGIPNSRTDGSYLTSRDTLDIIIPSGGVAAPTFSPPGGAYSAPIQVTMSSATTGAVIHYTTDGTVPTATSTTFTAPVPVSATTTIKAVAILGAQPPSAVATAVYTYPVAVANLAALRSQTTGTTVYQVTGEIVLTFKQTFRNQKFLQDNTAGIMIDDLAGIITTAYNVGDGITGLIGTLTEFGGMLEFVPTINPPAATSTGNVIIPQNITFSEFTNNFENYESELVVVGLASFDFPPTTFTVGTNYQLWQNEPTPNFINFRTTFYNVDYIGTQTPDVTIFVVGIPNSNANGNYITSRSLADFVMDTLDPPTDLTYLVLNLNDVELFWFPGPIPVKGRDSRDWTNLTALKVYRNNNLIATITDFVDYQSAGYNDNDLQGGLYSYYVTNVYFSQYESAPSNTVSVQITGNDDPVIPAANTALTGNYPNPFNPETTINYSVKNPAAVTITIYNLKGEKVRTLVNETKGNGFYKTGWNGKDDAGKAVTSGVYLYRMQAGNYVSTKRMMLMK